MAGKGSCLWRLNQQGFGASGAAGRLHCWGANVQLAARTMHAFVRRYSHVSREDIRKGRGSAVDQLGFIGRVMHGSNPRTWLRELRLRIGQPLYYLVTVL
jgi:hypothetical protein